MMGTSDLNVGGSRLQEPSAERINDLNLFALLGCCDATSLSSASACVKGVVGDRVAMVVARPTAGVADPSDALVDFGYEASLKFPAWSVDLQPMRLVRMVTLVGGLVLLVASLALVARDSRADNHNDLARQLEADSGTEAARLDEYFERAATIALQLSENPGFRSFYDLRGTRVERVRDGAAVEEANRALGFLETIYPESIGEACFIDAGGAENARVVRGEVATPAELSLDETTTPFFAPTFALEFGQVYQTEPYVSPDTEEWVVANATLVPFSDGVRRALVHFEVTVDSFRQMDAPDDIKLRIIDQSGQVIVDSDRPQLPGMALGWADDTQFHKLLADGLPPAGAETTLVTLLEDELVAVRPLSTGVVTPNNWYLVASAPAVTGWFPSLSVTGLVVLIGALVVFALAIVSMLAQERRLTNQAITDNLTGLPNRTLFADRVSQALRIAERNRMQAAVLLLDLNRFKEVNDTLGHHRGDQLLCDLATRLATAARSSDTIARLGGDEFAVLLPQTAGLHGAIEAAERIKAQLSAETEIEGVPFHVDGSIGIALYPDHGRTVADLLQHADVAMYRAKRAGLDYAVYSIDDDPHSAERLSLIAELRSGIDRGELVNHYQPKYDLRSMTVTSVEALVRWDHPRRGLISPDEFVPVAEISGLLGPLTNVVMRSAFKQVAKWSREGWSLSVAVNVSPRSFADPTFLADIDEALKASGAVPQQVIIEITENSLVNEPDASRRALNALRDRGFRISIDDFGTGYSSLNYLRHLPIDELKIDRCFVMGMTENLSDQAIVKSTISLAQNLGYDVVAEGIETREALDLLVSMGCDTGQGFHLCRPNEPAKLEPLRRAPATP